MEQTDRRRIAGILAAAGAVILCIVVFLVFGRRGEDEITPSQPTPPPVSAEPAGVRLEELIDALSNEPGFTVSGPADRHTRELCYTIERSGAEPCSLLVSTDSIGRTASVRIVIEYLKPDFETMTVGSPAYETLAREYERIQNVNAGTVNVFLDKVFGLVSAQAGIGAADEVTIRNAVEDSLKTLNTYSKKLGALKISGVTEMLNEQTAQFIAEVMIDASKLK